MYKNSRVRLGDLLLRDGKITAEQLQVALEVQKEKKIKIGEVLKELRYITSKEILDVLELQLGIPKVDLEKYNIDPEIPKLITEDFARKNLLIPIKKSGMHLTIAMSDPLNIILINDLEIITGFQVEPRITSDEDIKKAIDHYYSKNTAEQAVEEFTKDLEYAEGTDIDQDLLREINKAPVVRLVNTIIVQAAQQNASDIHIEPEDSFLRIRFRIDGDMQEIMKPSNQTHGAIVTRIKIMAKMNIAERRVPQDGRIELNVKNKDLDLRVSTIPTIYGEKIVIRMLDRSTFLKDKSELGMLDHDVSKFESVIKSQNGIILVTGPTGSGKSTTLYSILKEINDSKKNIITLEDPVEYRMSGVIQSQIHPKSGFTFASGLRSFLRQDPDIIMVGEIRDQETAEIAMRAAITGHLVLSTLHTNGAIPTINRLIDMNIESYLIASSIQAIISQLLIKRICEHCKVPYIPSEHEKEMLGIDTDDVELYKGIGCHHCKKTGYNGRIAVYEIVTLDSYARKLIVARDKNGELAPYLKKNGLISIQDNCKHLVTSGITTFDELLRISHSIEG